jgi:hypothetical protein
LLGGFNGGITTKYIQSKLDTYDVATYGIDAGLQRPFHNNKWFLSLVATNLLGTLKYVSDSVPLGQTIDLGFSMYNLFLKNLSLSADYRGLVNMSSDSFNTGLEYKWVINPPWSLSPRIGFKSYDSQLTYGLGFGYTAYQIDYAFVPHIDLGQSHRISLSVTF